MLRLTELQCLKKKKGEPLASQACGAPGVHVPKVGLGKLGAIPSNWRPPKNNNTAQILVYTRDSHPPNGAKDLA